MPRIEPGPRWSVDPTRLAYAPWTLVEAAYKRCARIKMLQTICEWLEPRLA